MKVFMGNRCGHPYCRSANCVKCRFYSPSCFGIKVPRWLGNALFAFESWLVEKGAHDGSF